MFVVILIMTFYYSK